MAERRCQTCYGVYVLPEGKPDPRFCSDRCFSASQGDEPEGGSRFWWAVKVALFFAVIALVMFRHDVAGQLARSPETRAVGCRALAWLGGESIDRLLELVLDPSGEPRATALEALTHVSDPAGAHPHVAAKLGDLRNLIQTLDVPTRCLMYRVFGACNVVEAIDDLIAAIEDDPFRLDALRGLSLMHEHRGTQPMLNQLAEADARLGTSPAELAELLTLLSLQPDTERALVSRFFPYLNHEKPEVRAAAARAIATIGQDYVALKERVPTVPIADQYVYKQRLARVEKGLAALQAAGPAEKEPTARAAIFDGVETMTGRAPEWSR